LPTPFATYARHRIFSKKNRKTVFADGLCQGRSAQVFLKNKTPLFADGPASRLSAKKISKTVTLTRR
jgi:hypothetical protein